MVRAQIIRYLNVRGERAAVLHIDIQMQDGRLSICDWVIIGENGAPVTNRAIRAATASTLRERETIAMLRMSVELDHPRCTNERFISCVSLHYAA